MKNPDKALIPLDFHCPEQYDAMRADGLGRRCAACNTVVVDFSEMEPEQIRGFLRKHADQKLCGVYRAEHTTLPTSRQRFGLRLLTRIERLKTHPFVRRSAAAIIILALGLSGCHRRVVSKFSKSDSHGVKRSPQSAMQSSR